MGIWTRLIVGIGWLALSYWAADKIIARRLVAFVTGVLVMLILCIKFMDVINPWLEQTRRISRESLKGLWIGMTAGLISGVVVSPFVAKVDWLYWSFQIILFLSWVILPSLPTRP